MFTLQGSRGPDFPNLTAKKNGYNAQAQTLVKISLKTLQQETDVAGKKIR